jgi:hypothetical protein
MKDHRLHEVDRNRASPTLAEAHRPEETLAKVY